MTYSSDYNSTLGKHIRFVHFVSIIRLFPIFIRFDLNHKKQQPQASGQAGSWDDVSDEWKLISRGEVTCLIRISGFWMIKRITWESWSVLGASFLRDHNLTTFLFRPDISSILSFSSLKQFHSNSTILFFFERSMVRLFVYDNYLPTYLRIPSKKCI